MGSQKSLPKQQLSPVQSQIWLISLKSQKHPFSHLSRNILREICEYLRVPQVLPALCGSYLSLHCLDDCRVNRVKLPVTFSDGVVCCVYGEEEIVCLGGDPPSADVYSYNVSSQVFATLSHMQRARAWPGIQAHSATIYVFGGSLCSCERLQTGTWVSLPDMLSPKYAFTPVLYCDQILLCAFASDVESFHIKHEAFRRLSLHLPGSNSPSIAFLVGDLLHVISRNRVVRWRMTTEESETWSLQIELCGCTGAPIRLRDRVYWADTAGRVVWYDLDRREVMQ